VKLAAVAVVYFSKKLFKPASIGPLQSPIKFPAINICILTSEALNFERPIHSCGNYAELAELPTDV